MLEHIPSQYVFQYWSKASRPSCMVVCACVPGCRHSATCISSTIGDGASRTPRTRCPCTQKLPRFATNMQLWRQSALRTVYLRLPLAMRAIPHRRVYAPRSEPTPTFVSDEHDVLRGPVLKLLAWSIRSAFRWVLFSAAEICLRLEGFHVGARFGEPVPRKDHQPAVACIHAVSHSHEGEGCRHIHCSHECAPPRELTERLTLESSLCPYCDEVCHGFMSPMIY